jgi:signal transduction histidine kinase
LKAKLNFSKMSRSSSWRYLIAGALSGYLVIHPLIMMIADWMIAEPSRADSFDPGHILAVIHNAFGFAMLPWGIGLGLLCAVVGWLLAKVGQARDRELKLKGVLEMAGAACHELNQPMQVVLGYSELLRTDLESDDPIREILVKIIGQVDRMDAVLKQIHSITTYETKAYYKGVSIIDIEKAAKQTDYTRGVIK